LKPPDEAVFVVRNRQNRPAVISEKAFVRNGEPTENRLTSGAKRANMVTRRSPPAENGRAKTKAENGKPTLLGCGKD